MQPFERVEVVGDEFTLGGHGMFVCCEPSRGLSRQRNRLPRSQEDKVVKIFARYGDEGQPMRKDLAEGPVHGRSRGGFWPLGKADEVQGQEAVVFEESVEVTEHFDAQQVAGHGPAGEAVVDDEVVLLVEAADFVAGVAD